MGMNAGDRLLGLIGQSMGGAKGQRTAGFSLLDVSGGASAVAGTFTAKTDGWYTVWMWGGGGGAPLSGNTFAGGGGGGAAGRKAMFLKAGQQLPYSAAAYIPGTATDGNPSTLTLPDGSVLTAGGGKKGSITAGVVALGGLCSGPFDMMRKGGDGGTGTSSGIAGTAGLPGDFGAVAGAGGVATGASAGGGGGSAGFSDVNPDLAGGAGATAVSGAVSATSPGGGLSGGSNGAGISGAGRIVIALSMTL